MAYGMQPGDTGHGDVRMLVPSSVRGLSSAIRSARKPLPQLGHVALLEWPTMNEKSEFRFSLLEPGGELFWQTERLLVRSHRDGWWVLGLVGCLRLCLLL